MKEPAKPRSPKKVPDLVAIERCNSERGAYVAELRELDVTDREKVARIRRDYGAEGRWLSEQLS